MSKCDDCEIKKWYARVVDYHIFDERDCPYICKYGSKEENKVMSKTKKETKLKNLEGMKGATYIYPAIFARDDNDTYSIRFPDIENCFTCGDDIEDGMKMAEDALALMIYSNYEEPGVEAPASSPIKDLKLEDNEFATYIVCDTTECRRKFGAKAVKKTLTIPAWLNEIAMRESINFSQVLQDALKEKLNVD